MTQQLASLAASLVCTSAIPSNAQVVVNRDGSLPPPSVAASDYPAMVECTLTKRGPDVEAILVARDQLYKSKLAKGEFGARDEEYGELRIQTVDVNVVKEARLVVQIIETCHPLREGYPTGFWTENLLSDWRKGLSFDRWAQPLSDSKFADCLSKHRPALIDNYLAAKPKTSDAKAIYGAFFTQRVCTPAFPAAIREIRVRKYLLLLRSGADA